MSEWIQCPVCKETMENLTECANCAQVKSLPEPCCASSHEPPDTACKGFERGENGRCVYCDHEEKCHPGPGATCEIGSGERGHRRKVMHRVRGECYVTDDCLQLQRYNGDKMSMFVELEGETLEVSRVLVDEIDFMRASGDCICDWCGKTYYQHPPYERMPGYDGSFPVNQLCDGRLVKL